eukprot:GEMP01025284.1.p1 GENE.GEMP01025284.1~~GEMP01025284.1.p1  ORF type:complete len:438 (+),score=114.66 GEMP01025284.1:81-1394(+)
MDHEETLLTFVNTAGPDTDLGFARALLEMHDWNLEAALNEVLAIPPETHHEQVRAPMRTNYHEQLIPQAADDDLAMAVQASLQHHDPFQPQMPPAFQGEDELQHAMERSFTDHMEQAIKISKLDNDYDEAVRMSKDPHRMTASRQGDRRRDGPVSQPIPDDSPAPDSSGTFAQVSNPFGRSSLPSSSAAAPTPIRAPALQAPPRQPPRPAAKLFGGQTYSSKASAAAASSSSQGGGQTSVPTAPSRPQLQPRLQQELEAEQRRKREELHQQKQEEERQRELHLEQQRNAALARASDAPRVPGSSAPPVINVPEVAAFSAMSTADKDKEKEKERETKARQCLQSMKKLPADQLQAAMKTLHAYISNLAKNPMDEKFHRINMENKNFASTVAPHEDAIALLMLCGFQKEGVFLVMDQAFIKSKGSFLWSVLSKVDVLRR